MTGDNLPPGVSVNDIPGNRPEDEAYEEFWDEVHAAVEGLDGLWDKTSGWDNEVEDLVTKAVDFAYELGKKHGADEMKQELGLSEAYEQES